LLHARLTRAPGQLKRRPISANTVHPLSTHSPSTPPYTLFPYTTLFQSAPTADDVSQHREDESRAFGGLSLKTLRVLTRLRNHVERWTQEVLSESLHGGILLIDGSLTAGTPDNPAARVNKILATARQNHSIVIGISKATH